MGPASSTPHKEIPQGSISNSFARHIFVKRLQKLSQQILGNPRPGPSSLPEEWSKTPSVFVVFFVLSVTEGNGQGI